MRYCLFGILLPIVGSSVAQSRKNDASRDFVFDVQPREIAPGETAVLRWSIKGATEITLEEAPDSTIGHGELHKLGTFEGGTGTLQVAPVEDTTYVISCVGATKYSCASLSVRVRVKRR